MRMQIQNIIGHKMQTKLRQGLSMALVCLIGFSLATAAKSAEDARPEILVFDTVAVREGISKDLAASATKAIHTYLRETRRVEPSIINRESPIVLRAIMEKALVLDDLASYSTREKKVEVAKALGFEYAIGAEISIVKDLKDIVDGTMPEPPKGKITESEKPKTDSEYIVVKMWLTRVNGGKTGQWTSTKASQIPGKSITEMDNAMQTSVSAGVLELTKQVFFKLKPQDEVSTPASEATIAVEPSQQHTGTMPNVTDYTSQADESLSVGNIARAIQLYSQAVSAEPSNGNLRIKLAEAYAHKGLYDQANNELDRAEKIGLDKTLIDASRLKIVKMETGITPTTEPKSQPSTEPAKTPIAELPPAVISDTKPENSANEAVKKLVEGDKLWRQGKTDEAALAYADAAKLNPADWRGYERIAAINASMSLFGEACKAIEKLKTIEPKPSPETVEKRYGMFRKAFDKAFANMLNQLDTDTADFSQKIITRESYHATVNGFGLRLESMTKFLDTLAVPSANQNANLRRSLACGLLAQASASMLEYLESNNKKAKQNAEVFIAQAKKESQTAISLDARLVAVPPTPAPETKPED